MPEPGYTVPITPEQEEAFKDFMKDVPKTTAESYYEKIREAEEIMQEKADQLSKDEQKAIIIMKDLMSRQVDCPPEFLDIMEKNEKDLL